MTISRERKTAVGLGVVVVVMIGAVIQLVMLGGGDDGGQDNARPDSTDAATDASTPAAPTTTGPPVEYQVQPGDTLTSIAAEFDVPTDAIIAANQLTNPDNLTEGQTLLIPSVPPAQIVVTPATATPGRTLQLELSGANPSESITFEIRSPDTSFTGDPHTASEDGRVATTYTLNNGDPPGTYTVVATGDQGTTAESTFEVESPA